MSTRAFLSELSSSAKVEMAKSDKVPDEFWELLKNDVSEEVRAACCSNLRITEKEVDEFLCSSTWKEVISLSRDARLNERQVWEVIEKKNWVAHAELTRNQRLINEQIKKLLNLYSNYSGDEGQIAVNFVLRGLFANSATTEEDFVWALENIKPTQDIVKVLVGCECTPCKVLEGIYWSTESKSIKRDIIRHKNAGIAILRDALELGYEEEVYNNPGCPKNIKESLEMGFARRISGTFFNR